jgi:putative transposase
VRELGVSERKACAVLGQHRSTQRNAPRGSDDEAALTADIVELAKRYGRYGYRRIAALLRDAGDQPPSGGPGGILVGDDGRACS